MAKVAFVVGEDFEDSEFRVPYDRIREAGHEVVIIGARPGKVKGKQGKERVTIEKTPSQVNPRDFDALVIPGGYSPDHLRMSDEIVQFVKEMAESGKLIAAVCHGPSLLIDADLVRGRRVASWPSIRVDLINAGAKWEDQPVVEDGNLITSRKPEDLEQFSEAILKRIGAPAGARA